MLVACGGGGGGASFAVDELTVYVVEDSFAQGHLVVRPSNAGYRFSVTTPPQHGTASSYTDEGVVSYWPAPDYVGNDEFEVVVKRDNERVYAQVRVVVTPAPDPPRFSLLAPAEALGGTITPLPAQFFDPDGTAVFAARQLSGFALTAVTVTPGGISVTAPAVTTVQHAELEVSATVPGSAPETWTFDLAVLPVSASGRLRTISGAPSATGHHWVIVGDGYRADQYIDFRNDIEVIIDTVYGVPPLDVLRPAVNIHLLWQPSAQEGVDIPSQSVFVDTAFGAYLECAGIGRLLCVDYTAVYAALDAELPVYDQALVVVNTEEYGGAGGGSVATSTVGFLYPQIALHELGHSVAGLGDEYPDDQLAGMIPADFDDWYPNLTANTDPQTVKWSRWIADMNAIPSGNDDPRIGRFEGGWYRWTDIWRPTWASFMRSMGNGVDPISSEAWALAFYRQAGPIVATTPAAGTVAATPGQQVTLSVTPLLEPGRQQLRWYVDGVEQTAWAGLTSVVATAPATGTRVIELRTKDASGLVHPTYADADAVTLTWTLEVP